MILADSGSIRVSAHARERLVGRCRLLPLQPIDEPWHGRSMQRIGESLPVAGHEPIEEPLAIVGPSTPPDHQIDRTEEPGDVDERRSPGGIVEIVQPPRALGEGVLLQVRITMELDGRLTGQIGGEDVADRDVHSWLTNLK
jgi:hypothetical protein